MIRDVYEYPSSILEKRMPDVKMFGPGVVPLLQDMRETLVQTGAVGLAANQVGALARVCIIILGTDRVQEFINPAIIWQSGKIYSQEACLSIPDYTAIIPRSTDVRVGYQNRDGKTAVMTLSGPYAIRAQHEIDHLNGILIRDYVEGLKGKSGGISELAGKIE